MVTITHYEARKGVTVGAPRPCQVYRRMSGEVRLAAAVLVTTPLVTPRSVRPAVALCNQATPATSENM